jgi:hypothetical protein
MSQYERVDVCAVSAASVVMAERVAFERSPEVHGRPQRIAVVREPDPCSQVPEDLPERPIAEEFDAALAIGLGETFDLGQGFVDRAKLHDPAAGHVASVDGCV